jgi:pimeloyl-ACP methyl ester carboxylesterase
MTAKFLGGIGMEQITFRNSRDLRLVGNLYSSNSKSIIIMCHGFMSNKYSKGRFEKLAIAFNKCGFDALAFDFSGCGESDNDSLTIEKEVDDLKSAISYVISKGYEKIALYGYSLGTLICLKSYIPQITTMVLLGALTGPMEYNWDEFFTQEQMKELKENGFITEYISGGTREKIIIDRKIIEGFELINQKELLGRIKCPTLLIHGDGDEEESLLYERSKVAINMLSADSRIEVINESNHSFLDHFDMVVKLSTDWLKKYL